MVEFHAGRLYWLLNGLVAVMVDLEKRGHPTLSDREELGIRNWADAADRICANCDIDASYYTERIRRKVDRPTELKYTVASAVDQLRHYIVKELRGRKFMFVPSAEYEYYDHPRLFGGEVENKFPSANKEITFAGNCYAL